MAQMVNEWFHRIMDEIVPYVALWDELPNLRDEPFQP